jgi:enoyl-CoA hydratase/carnithine racemase
LQAGKLCKQESLASIREEIMATSKVLYEKRSPVAYVTLNRPEVKNAIDVETHERLCEIWTDFRDDPAMRVAIITGAGDAFTAGADLKTHAPEWQTVGPMVGREPGAVLQADRRCH